MAQDGRRRVLAFNLTPRVDDGRYPIKRVLGDIVRVEVDLVGDGHDVVDGCLRWRSQARVPWQQARLTALGNDRYTASFTVETIGHYDYQAIGWIDEFATWRQRFVKKVEAGQELENELLHLKDMVEMRLRVFEAKRRPSDQIRRGLDALHDIRSRLAAERDFAERVQAAVSDTLLQGMQACPRRVSTGESPVYRVRVDPIRAVYGAWYEFFPRSCPTKPLPDAHGTWADCEAFLPYVRDLGFDVVYLPPIHPIGVQHRKGCNNQVTAGEGDPGSPWAIGDVTGGHTAIHPQLGTLDDFERFQARVRELGMDLALDIAFQCSPDHPWVTEHPQWFKHFPDGSIQYAENPPKKYEDVYPLNFETDDWENLWQALWRVVDYWAARKVSIFRVDNPHTKPLAFWEWLIAKTHERYPEAVFLSEAFTRPKLMYALSKIGFSQSYTYFTWRTTGPEIREYLEELTQSDAREFFRPNFWPNTPDILPLHLQSGTFAAFAVRFVLAATLSASYGIYGPAFELLEHEAARPGTEEYLNSEKYEIRDWDLTRQPNLQGLIRRVNHIRHQEPGFHNNHTLVFHRTDNPQLLAYSKRDPETGSAVLVVVNLDASFVQSGWTDLAMSELGLREDQAFWAHDLLSDARYPWTGRHNYVELHPDWLPAHILRIEPR